MKTQNNFLKVSKQIGKELKKIPKIWNGERSILEMRKAGYNQWRQTEWIGWYFQFLCRQCLSEIVEIPGSKYGHTDFDGFKDTPWDFKAHAINTSAHQVIINDSMAIANAIRDFGAVGLILALGEVKYNDEKRTFQRWHEKLKGGPSKYSLERMKRGAWSRLRKVSFDLEQISFIKITDKTLVKCGSFQKDFRNADGKPRNEKILLDLEQIDEELVYFVEF